MEYAHGPQVFSQNAGRSEPREQERCGGDQAHNAEVIELAEAEKEIRHEIDRRQQVDEAERRHELL